MKPALALLGPVLLAAAHPTSLSYLEVQVSDRTLELRFLPQTLTLIENLDLGLDRDHDYELSAAELEAGWPAIQDYLEAGLSIEVDGQVRHPRFEEHGFAREQAPQDPGLSGSDRLLLLAHLPVERKPEALRVRSDLFYDEGNPDHRMHVTVSGLGHWEQEVTMLDARYREASFPRQSGSVLGIYLELGWRHVLDGYDHLAFLVSLLLGVASLRALFTAVTAFTLAHSITLSLSALAVFALPPGVVEPGIALSVLFVLWLHLRLGPEGARPWIPAFGFGLLHGFGFAGALGAIGLPEHARLTALLGFNLGVELGQLTFVAPVALAGALVLGRLRPGARAELRLAVGIAVGALALGFCGNAFMTQAFPGLLWSAPAVLRPVPAALILAAALALWLQRARTPAGQRLLPAVGLSLGLYLLFVAGRFAGGVL